MYNSRPRGVKIAPYRHPTSYYVKAEEPGMPAFHFDGGLNPILRVEGAQELYAKAAYDESDDFTPWSADDSVVLGASTAPLLSDAPLSTEDTAHGIALYFAPAPFNLRSSRTKRATDVPLVHQWFTSRCSRDAPVKVRVSYQKLLKMWVLNKLHARKERSLNKKYLFRR